MVSIEYAHLLPILRVPDVDPAVTRPRDHKLGVWREGGFQWQLFGVEVAGEGLESCTVVGVNQLNDRPIG